MIPRIAIVLALTVGALASPALRAADVQPAEIAKRSSPAGVGDIPAP